MKKKILIHAMGLCLCLSAFTVMAQNNAGAKASVATSIIVNHNAFVPKNYTYYLYDDPGTKLLATFTAGQTVNILHYKKAKQQTKDAPKMDCVQINCPTSFGSGAVCWKCK